MLLLAEFTFSWLWLAEVLIAVCLYATLAASLNLVTGCAGMFSLGHHGFFAVGAYAAGWFVSLFPGVAVASPAAWLLFLGSALVAALAAAAAGFLVGLPCLRLKGDYLAIATLAFGEIVRITIQNTPALGGSTELYVARTVASPSGLAEVESFRNLFLVVGVLLAAATGVVVRNLVRSAHGRAIVSLREDELAADLLGVRTTKTKILVFALGAALAGLGGWFYAHYTSSIAPANFDLLVGIRILLIVVLGGLGSLSGTFVAAFLLIGLERLLLTGVFGQTAKEWMQVEYAALLILLMLLRPNGLFGSREVADLFRRRASGPVAPAGKAP
jgi:branched-chain amino acid transport system permease protein